MLRLTLQNYGTFTNETTFLEKKLIEVINKKIFWKSKFSKIFFNLLIVRCLIF